MQEQYPERTSQNSDGGESNFSGSVTETEGPPPTARDYRFTGPRYLSSQSRLSRMKSLRGGAWPDS
jgi:hypothetical protein